MKRFVALFLFLALCASSAFAQETNRGFFLPSSGDCGSINNPVTDGAACLQTITANGRTAGTLYIYKGPVTGWQAGSGAGVTDFSAGNLSPLFTTSVATSTTTPALTFSLSTAAANTVLGNASSSTGPPSYGQIVAGQIASNAVTTAKILDANVTYAKIQNVTDARLIGRSAGSTGAPQEITVGTGLSLAAGSLTATGGNAITALTGDVTATGPGSVAATIANSAVSLAKIANAAASSKLLGSGASGIGASYAEITLGTNLSMTGTTLNGAGGTTPITLGSQSLTVTLTNDTSTGTTAGLLIKVNSSNQAVTIGTSDTTGIFGICVDISGASTACGNTGSSTIAVLGTASCQFDGATTAGHFVIASTTSAGKCHDGGATYPATVAVLGTVQSTNGAGGTYSMFFQTPDVTSASNTPSGGGRGTSVLVNGSGLSSVRGSLNDTTPVATAGNKLVTWQKDTANPTLISAQVSASGLLDVLGTTRGSIAYRGASGWTPLVPNTPGFVLTDGGVGADPAWAAAGGGGGLTLVQKQTVTVDTTDVTFSALDGNTDEVYLLMGRLKVATGSNVDFLLRPNGSTATDGTLKGIYAGDFGTGYGNAASTSSFRLIQLANTGDWYAFSITLHVKKNPNSVAAPMLVNGTWSKIDTGAGQANGFVGGFWNETSTNITSLIIHSAAATGIASGSTFALYKYAQS